MERATKVVRVADRALNALIAGALLLVALFAGSALWDMLTVYNGARASASPLSLSELSAANPDVCAWLTVDGTGIDYPVVHGKSNGEYLNKDVQGRFALSGSIFLDYRNHPDFCDPYSLIYGHHMDGGVMFGDLARFAEASYFAGHTTGTLRLATQTYEVELFACLVTDAYDEVVFNPGIVGEDQRRALLNYVKEHAVQYREPVPSTDAPIVGLSTCSDTTTNGRTVVFGQLKTVAASKLEGGV